MVMPPRPEGLRGSSILVATGDPEAGEQVVRVLRSLGAGEIKSCRTAAQGRALVRTRAFDLCVADSVLPDGDGADFVAWLRRSRYAPACAAPVIVLAERPTRAEVLRLRDGGVSALVRKPVDPVVLSQRLLWALRDSRPFVMSPGYRGPERRARRQGPPHGQCGRRRGDLSARPGPAAGANLHQAEIDLIIAARP